MLVGNNAADWHEYHEGEHDEIKKCDEGFLLDIFWQSHSSTEENGGGNHSVGRREARLAGAVWAHVPNKNMIKEEIGNNHK